MKSKILIVLTMWLTTVCTVFSQRQEFNTYKNLGIGLKVSPFLGYGIEAASGLNNHFILRLGFNLTKGINVGYFNFDVEESYELENAFGYIPEARVKPSLDFVHGNLLLDYHPGGVFHITTGFFAGTTKIGVKGYLADSQNNKAELLSGKNWPSVEIGDQSIDIKDGNVTGHFRIGNTIKPYFGIGVGRAIAKNKRVAFKFELGLLYQDSLYEIKMNGKNIDLANATDEDLREIHEKFTEQQYFKFWPQINFQLSYRIF